MALTDSLMLASLVALCPSIGALKSDFSEPELDAFHSYMREHGRSYRLGSAEYRRRLSLFSRRAAEVEAHNSRADRLWSAGINHLSDRTAEELARLRGRRGAASAGGAAPARPSGGGTFLSQRGQGRALPALPQEFMNWTSLESAGRIIDQGGCGSCWAVSSAAVLQQHLEIYSPASKRTFSAQELVSCVPNPHMCGGAGGCEGATIELAFHWALNEGLAEEREAPYSGTDGVCQKRSSGGMLQLGGGYADLSVDDLAKPGVHLARSGARGLSFGMHGWERLPENEYEPLLRAVYERGPVGVSVAAKAWAMYSKGIFNGCSKDAVIDHAVVLVGYGKDEKLGKGFYLIRNSWGPAWGEHGHIRLLRREDDSEQCGVDRKPEVGTACKGGPKVVKVCGMCGVLYDSAVPHFNKLSA
uniref:Peptidase C1A papain C-terminal domain-containing protein n=1 Tax=Alexandrium monilatum TaxID=311494 RepID=A0A7S4T6H5_9DINO